MTHERIIICETKMRRVSINLSEIEQNNHLVKETFD